MAETIGLVAGSDDMAVMCEPVQQRRGHLGVVEDGRPLSEGQFGSDHHAGVPVELRQVGQQRLAGLAEWRLSARKITPSDGEESRPSITNAQ